MNSAEIIADLLDQAHHSTATALRIVVSDPKLYAAAATIHPYTTTESAISEIVARLDKLATQFEEMTHD